MRTMMWHIGAYLKVCVSYCIHVYTCIAYTNLYIVIHAAIYSSNI